MLDDLNGLLASHARLADTTEQFGRFMDRARGLLPREPAHHRRADRRAGGQIRGRATHAELAVGRPAGRAGRADASRHSAIRGWRSHWRNWTRCCSSCGPVRTGTVPDGSAATTRWAWARPPGRMEELGRLEALSEQLAQSYPGARLDDIDLDLLEQVLGDAGPGGRPCARRSGAGTAGAGHRSSGPPTAHCALSPKALRRLGESALRDVVDRLGRPAAASGRPGGPAPPGEATGASRPWAFGDTEAWDVPRTLLNAQLRRAGGDDAAAGRHRRRGGRDRAPYPGGGGAVRRHLLVDGAGRALGADEAHGARAAPADLHPVPRRRPEARSRSAGTPRRSTWASSIGLEGVYVQGTNLHHALMLAGAAPAPATRTPRPVVLVVTDGEPTAHLEPDGTPVFQYPTEPETLHATVAELDRLTGAAGGDHVLRPRRRPAAGGVHGRLARRCGGRVVAPTWTGWAPRWSPTTCATADDQLRALRRRAGAGEPALGLGRTSRGRERAVALPGVRAAARPRDRGEARTRMVGVRTLSAGAMQTWAPVDVPVLEGSGPPLRLHDTATGRVRPTAPGRRRPRCTSAGSPPTTPPTSATPPPTWRSTWSTGCGGTSGTTCTTSRTSPTSTTPCWSAPPATSDDWVVLGMRETALFREDMEALRVLPPRALHRRGRGDGRDRRAGGQAARAGRGLPRRRPGVPRRLLRRRVHRPVRLRVELRRGHDAGLRPRARRRPRPARQALPARPAAVAHGARRRAVVGVRPGRGQAGLARRVRGDRAQPARHADRPQRRRLRPDLPAPRVRRRARRGVHRRAPLRPPLHAHRDDRPRRREDVQVAGQPGVRLEAARAGRRPERDPAGAAGRALPQRPRVDRRPARRGRGAARPLARRPWRCRPGRPRPISSCACAPTSPTTSTRPGRSPPSTRGPGRRSSAAAPTRTRPGSSGRRSTRCWGWLSRA